MQEAGVYAFRTLYLEGNGDASIEWLVVKPDGTRVLINDTANGGPRSFQQGTVPSKPADKVVITIKSSLGGEATLITLEWASGVQSVLESAAVAQPVSVSASHESTR